MTVRRLCAAALFPPVLALTGCAGTEPPAGQEAAGSAATGSSATGSSATSAPAAPSTGGVPAPATTAGRRIEVRVAGGKVSGDTGRVPVALGDPVTLVVTSDAADELHVHGYDRTVELVPGRPAELSFDATVPGVFEAELHEAGTVLLTLQVG
jgi:hypothetical protein